MARKPIIRVTRDGGNRRIIIERFKSNSPVDKIKPVQKLVIDNHEDAINLINALAVYLANTEDPEDDQEFDDWQLPFEGI